MVSAQGRNQRPQGLNVNERPVIAATEEGFTGPKAGWFDGKFEGRILFMGNTIFP